MADAPKLTARGRRALEWLATNEPVSLFPIDGACTLQWARKFAKIGLAETSGVEGGYFGFYKYRTTAAGRQALENAR